MRRRNLTASMAIVLVVKGILHLSSCTTMHLAPIPIADRVPLRIEITDRTGSGADSTLASAIMRRVADDHSWTIHCVDGSGWSTRACWLRVVQNPFRLASPSDTSALHIRGDLEIASYGPMVDTREMLSEFFFFGLLGAGLLANARDDVLVAALQYRSAADGPVTGDAALVRTAHRGDVQKVSRYELEQSVNEDASRSVLFNFIQAHAETGTVSIRQVQYTTDSERAAEYRLSQITGSRR